MDLDKFQKIVEKTNIHIPKNFNISGVRTLTEQLNECKECVFLAKGPSLCFAKDYIKNKHVATVNEACLYVSGSIDYAFFYDKNALENSKPAWSKIKTFVMSSLLYGDKINDPYVPIDEIKDLPLERVVTFYEDQHEWDYIKIKESIVKGRFINTDTAVMGLHFLVLSGYKNIFLLGHDGGIGYANGVHGISKKRDLTRFREIIEFVSNEFRNKYSVKIEFYGD